jgi:hypothetical protein
MPNYLFTIPASDACIRFMMRYPDSIWNFAEGEPPSEESLKSTPRRSIQDQYGVDLAPRPSPADWPTKRPIMVAEPCHRNVRLYHFILNWTPKLVTGSGSIFQTWFSRTHAAIDFTGRGEHFGFLSPQLPELASLYDDVSKDALAERFRMHVLREGKDGDLCPTEIDFVWREFRALGDQARECADKGLGLIWLTV